VGPLNVISDQISAIRKQEEEEVKEFGKSKDNAPTGSG
jgi:hypothetical protein